MMGEIDRDKLCRSLGFKDSMELYKFIQAGAQKRSIVLLQKGLNARADSVLFRSIGKSQVIGELAGEVKIVSDAENGRVLGVHIIGPHATDLIAEGTLAVNTGCTVQDLAETIHAHPTLSEITAERRA